MIEPRTSTFLRIVPFTALNFLQIVLDETCTILVLPQIQKDLQISESLAQWISSAYYICNSASSIPLARVGDNCGYLLVYRLLCVSSCLVQVLVLWADEFWAILLLRMLTGVLNSGITSIFNIVKVNLLRPDIATTELYKSVVLSNFLSILIPIVGALLAYYFSWKTIYLTCGAIGVVNFGVSFFYRNFSRQTLITLDGAEQPEQRRFDLLGASIFALFMACFCLSFTFLSYFDYMLFGVFFAATVGLLVLFLFVEYKSANPLVPRFVFRLPVSPLLLLYIFLYFGVTCANWVMPQVIEYYQSPYLYSGLITAVQATACLITSVVCTFIGRHLVLRVLIELSYVLLNVIIVSSGLSVGNETLYAISYIVSFFFFAVQMYNLYVLLLRSVPQSCVSMISGLQACMRTFGQSISLSFFTMIYTVSVNSNSREQSYAIVMYSLLPFTVIGCVISFFFVQNSPEEHGKIGFSLSRCRTIDI